MYRDYGFLAPQGGIATTPEEASELAAKIGFPVVLKIVSPDILHKTDVGGVELDCSSEEEAAAAFSRIMSSVRQKAPQARIEGVSVEEMCKKGVETIIGLNNDPQFGPVVMFGLGGIFTEVLNDVSFRVLPITREDARSMIEEIKGSAILRGFRGQAPVSMEMLIDLLMKASQMGMDLGARLDSVDFNPVVVWEDQHRVLDAKILLRDEKANVPKDAPDVSHLEAFFKARSVALIGASATPGKVGNAVLDSLAFHGYKGKVWPVNPGKEEVMGLKAYPSLSSIPEPVDLVVVTVALSMVPDIIRECGQQGIHNMVVISGGGKELAGETRDLESNIRALAKQHSVRIIGCNCIGVLDAEEQLDTFFMVHERLTRPPAGPIGLITQSGTVGVAFLESAGDVGISKFVSYGNRIDVDEADLISYLGDDPKTTVIACYIEGLERGRKFLDTIREVSKKKPIVVFKAGRSKRGAAASMSHTGFFGGSYGVSAGALKQAGVITVDSMEEFYATAKALAKQPRAAGNRVAMISNGAGTMVQAMDLMEQYGLDMQPLAPESVAKLREVYPAYYLVQNPVDVTGSGTSADYEAGIRALLDDPNVDIVMPWIVFQDTPLDEGIVDALGRLTALGKKPIVCGSMGGEYSRRMSEAIEAQGVPVLHSVRDWVAAAHGLVLTAGK